MRSVVLKLAREIGIAVAEEFREPEFFIGRGRSPRLGGERDLAGGKIDGVPVGNGPGPVFRALGAAYRELIAANPEDRYVGGIGGFERRLIALESKTVSRKASSSI